MRHRNRGQSVLDQMFDDFLMERLALSNEAEKKKKEAPKGKGLTFSEGMVFAIVMQPIVGAVTKAILIHLGVN